MPKEELTVSNTKTIDQHQSGRNRAYERLTPESAILLADPRRRIAAVSDALGFPHQSHFATTFRALVGTTPRAYQRQRGGEKNSKIPQKPHESVRPHQGVWNRMWLRSGRLLICEKPDTYCPQGEVHDCARAAGPRVASSRRLRSEALSSGALPSWASLMSRRSRSCRRGQPL
jgi:hypothetical protein